MPKDPRLNTIPRGNTSHGVHQAIIEYLLQSGNSWEGKAMLDMPCGEGSFLSSLRLFFPKARLYGSDLQKPTNIEQSAFSQIDANHPFTVFPGIKFDCIFSISGVMEFDNTLQFFTQCRNHLGDGGIFVVTYDNVAGIRDRFSYFWFGKPKQYSLFVIQEQPTWKVIPLSNMLRILQDAGFRIQKIRYVPLRLKDWWALPVALVIYPIQLLHMRRVRTSIPEHLRTEMYPFRSLLSRHYFIVCEKEPSSAT
jgi:cyclopropane fatty-acyl-phospholipid synthase-like methyltransferase